MREPGQAGAVGLRVPKCPSTMGRSSPDEAVAVVEYRILGSVEVADGGLTKDLGGHRERTLLAQLLLSAGQVVSADRLAEDLWAGDPPPHSTATLRVYVSRLRRALGPGSAGLVTQPPGYRMALQPGQLDAHRFEALTAQARADLAAGRPEAAAARLRQALGLWRGPALSDVADFSFARSDVVRLEEARLAALEDRVEADLACGRHTSLTSELDGLMASHPLRERLCGQRMLALYRCGRQADALQAYQDLRSRLADELGIDPNPGLSRLQQAILRQEPDLDWPPAGWVPAAAPGRDAAAAEGGDRAPDRAAAGAAQDLPDAQDGAYQPERPGSGLPAETTSFIGREAELARIEELLGLSRLLTLAGPSGSGKTRLALRAAAQSSGSYPGGVWLVELAPVTAPGLVAAATAAALGIREEPGRPPADTIAAHLRDSEALLVVDNCEHMRDAAAELIAALLRDCPSLRVLATSQSRLGLSGEAIWPIPPLTLPDPAARDPRTVAEAEAVRLFCDRAALARPGFEMTEVNAGAVSEVCRRLDGIPLAIELAAARVNALTARQLAARLDDRFRLLTGGSRGGLPRHRTLRAAIEWSHDLLTATEQLCLRRMAVFAGGCTLEAAEAVCADDELPLDAVFETITSLVDRSLLTADEQFDSMRYGMLESIRHYALERLDQAGERAELHRRRRAWLLQFVGQADLVGPDQAAWLDLLEAEHDNFSAGLEWSLAVGESESESALALAGGLARFWLVRGHIGQGRRWLDAALAAARPADDRRLLATALDGAGLIAHVQADHDAQTGYVDQSLKIWRDLGDDAHIANCLGQLGAVAHGRGDYPAALQIYDEALELAERSGNIRQLALTLSGLGLLSLHSGELAKATGYYEQSIARFREAGDLRNATLILGNLGVAAINQGDLDLARTRLEDHLASARKLGDRKLTGGALTNLGMVAYDSGDLDRADQLHQEALDLAGQVGDRRLASVALTNLGLVARAQKNYSAARSFLSRSLELAEAVGDRRAVAESLEEIAGVDAAIGNTKSAAVLIGASAALRSAIGAPLPAPDLARFNATASAVRTAMGEDRYLAAQAQGGAMSAADAVAFARERDLTGQQGRELNWAGEDDDGDQ